MRRRLGGLPIVVGAVLACLGIARAQNTAPKWSNDSQAFPEEYIRQKKAPAPKRDISGTWDTGGPTGIQAFGAKNMPSDGKPEHELPYTAAGRQAFLANKPGFGVTEVPAAEANDPVDFCDPTGTPRDDLFELRVTQIVQLPKKVLILYEFDQVWRVIWTDGRELPKDPVPRWFGYSVAKWEDDYTFVVHTVGMDERTWLDNAGRPHSGEMQVEERFHRLDHDTLELTVTINDPKMYAKPWVAMDKQALYLRPDDYDVQEMICSPSETAEYNKVVGKSVDVGVTKPTK
jgi:hypothetical protein